MSPGNAELHFLNVLRSVEVRGHCRALPVPAWNRSAWGAPTRQGVQGICSLSTVARPAAPCEANSGKRESVTQAVADRAAQQPMVAVARTTFVPTLAGDWPVTGARYWGPLLARYWIVSP